MTPLTPLIREVVLWILNPTRVPWLDGEEPSKIREGVTVFGSAVILAAIYWGLLEHQQLYFEQIDPNLLFLLDTLVIPIALSMLLHLLVGRPASDLNKVFQTASWLYRAWTLQILLIWFWALVLRHRNILETQQGPVVSDFSVVLFCTTTIVCALTATSMRQGNENWKNIFFAWVVYCLATFVYSQLQIPPVGQFPWWAPDIPPMGSIH